MHDTLFCSVIIPTVGRVTLSKAVASVLEQETNGLSFEIIVVNDGLHPLPALGWQNDPRVRIVRTYGRERSVARNAGAAVSLGEYLYFLDDDDWLLPGALRILGGLTETYPDCVLYYGGLRVVDEQEGVVAVLNSGLQGHNFAKVLGGAWVPIQATIFRATAFQAVGMFDTRIIGIEDLDLTLRLAAVGPVASTAEEVACLYRGRQWSTITTTNYLALAEMMRLSRDEAARLPNTVRRLLSEPLSAYWYGRLLHVYISLLLWHVRRRRVFKALSRALSGTAIIWAGGRHVATRDFWNGVRDNHTPGSLHFVVAAMEGKQRASAQPDTE